MLLYINRFKWEGKRQKDFYYSLQQKEKFSKMHGENEVWSLPMAFDTISTTYASRKNETQSD